MPKRYADHSQHAHTDNAEQYGGYSDSSHERQVVTFVFEDGKWCLRWRDKPAGPDMYRAGAWKGHQLPREDIVWPFDGYPVDEFGRGVSFMESRHLLPTRATAVAA